MGVPDDVTKRRIGGRANVQIEKLSVYFDRKRPKAELDGSQRLP